MKHKRGDKMGMGTKSTVEGVSFSLEEILTLGLEEMGSMCEALSLEE